MDYTIYNSGSVNPYSTYNTVFAQMCERYNPNNEEQFIGTLNSIYDFYFLKYFESYVLQQYNSIYQSVSYKEQYISYNLSSSYIADIYKRIITLIKDRISFVENNYAINNYSIASGSVIGVGSINGGATIHFSTGYVALPDAILEKLKREKEIEKVELDKLIRAAKKVPDEEWQEFVNELRIMKE